MPLFHRRPLAIASLALLLSSFITFLLNKNGISRLWALIPFLVFLLLSLLLPLLRRHKPQFLFPFLSLFLLLGLLSQSIYDDIHHRPWRDTDPNTRHTITATVNEASYDTREYTYTIAVDMLDGKRVSLSLLLIDRSKDRELPVGSHITCDVLVRESSLPNRYADGIAGSATAFYTPYESDSEKGNSRNDITTLRALLKYRLREGTSGDVSALYSALLLGDRDALSPAVSRNFQRSGLSHALALSGLHLSILAFLLLRLLRLLPLPRFLNFLALALFLISYTTIAGFPLSLIRAALMLLILELSGLLRLFSDSVTSLFFSVALIVLFSPPSVADIGLLLSFLATLGILIAFEILPKPKRKRNPAVKLLRPILLSLISTFSAILFTAGVTVLVFGDFSLLTPLSNILITPFLWLILLIAPFLLAFPAAIGPLATLLGDAALSLTAWLSKIRGAYVSVSYPPVFIAVGALTLTLLLLLILKHKPKTALLSLVTMFLVTIAVFLSCHLTEHGQATVFYTRSFQDEYITLRTEGHITVIDHATSPSSVSELKNTLRDAHITEIDTLVITRYSTESADHIVALTEELTVRRLLLLPSAESQNEQNAHVLEALTGIPSEIASAYAPIAGELTFRYITAGSDGSIALHATHKGYDLLYASPTILSSLDVEERAVLLKDKDLIVFSAEPTASDRLPELPIPQESAVVAPHVWMLTEEIKKLPHLYREPSDLILPIS